MPLEELQKHLFLLRDRDATNHLLRVSAGLDSLVMGEGQILAQARGPRRAAASPGAPRRAQTAAGSIFVPSGQEEPACQRGATLPWRRVYAAAGRAPPPPVGPPRSLPAALGASV